MKRMPKRPHPHLLEVHALVFLKRMSKKYGQALTLSTVPDKEWQALANQGFDYFWLMGAWRRSPAARRLARTLPEKRKEYDAVLPGWQEQDVNGSPYAVYGYTLHPQLGGKDSLRLLKQKLNQAGLRLILDFVPNHLAMDHPWTVSQPDFFIQGTAEDHAKDPSLFYNTGKNYLAHGKDPYFPAWQDTVQFNFFSNLGRRAVQMELLKIAEVSDGVRCDMAMLGLNKIFEKTWEPYLKKEDRPRKEFWQEMIESVRGLYSEFTFMAEAYWETEWELQQLGFDFTYDKKLYDRMAGTDPNAVRDHLKADLAFQTRLVRFVENHDEPRAAALLGREKAEAAAMIMGTLPGMRLFHDGQVEGKKLKLPVTFQTEPEETVDNEMREFYSRLFKATNTLLMHYGRWQMVEVLPAEGEASLAWAWELGSDVKIIAVNYSAQPAKGKLSFRSRDFNLDLGPWKHQWFELKLPAPAKQQI